MNYNQITEQHFYEEEEYVKNGGGAKEEVRPQARKDEEEG